jgi:4-hydroxy-4-methyl-2-oxoglutarate aldolase
VAALVIDDGIRDSASLAAPPSVAARGVSSLGTQKRRFRSLNEPIALGGVLVRPGDWIVGDADGICVIPAPRLEALLAAAAARTAKEEGFRSALRNGRTTVDVLGLTGLAEKGDMHT